MNKPTRLALALTATAGILIAGSAATAPTASAAYGCERVTTNTMNRMACETAFNRANLSPMSASGVVSMQYDWCQIKVIRGAAEAYRLVNNRVGVTKGNAIGYGADAWRC